MPANSKRPHGQIRQSQVVTTFGPGSLMDLPHQSVIIAGLEQWLQKGPEIHEPRLIEKLKKILNLPDLKLYAPPPDNDDPTAPTTGIRAWVFPQWFTTQDATQENRKGLNVRCRRLIPRRALTKNRFVDESKKRHAVVPIRFVRACKKGHINDIDWYKFVHQRNLECRRPLTIEERGTSGDLGENVIRCECGEERRLSDAQAQGALGKCFGERLWLGNGNREENGCEEMNRLLIRHASNAYFSQTMPVISLPDRNESLEKAVNQVWENFLESVESVEDVAYERRKKQPVKNALEGFTDDEVFEEVQARKGLGEDRPVVSVKQAEFEALIGTTKVSMEGDIPETEFFARVLPHQVWNKPIMDCVEKVVLVHRLREVVAQIGFTRFEAITPDIEGELQFGAEAAPLANEVSWLPAIENRGEGIFIQFKSSLIQEWLARPNVKKREEELRAGFEAWKSQHPNSTRTFPGAAYYFVHTLSHLLLIAVALECGYPASSIRERVYVLPQGYGIMLYTGTPDAEGTLGGLIEAGKNIARHLQTALEIARLCSNDPVCAEHQPVNIHENRHLHGAACHGCLLISETSCEQHNDFLDRALVIATVFDNEAEFFSGV